MERPTLRGTALSDVGENAVTEEEEGENERPAKL